MIDLKLMYELYIQEINYKIQSLLEKLSIYTSSKDSIVKVLSQYEDFFSTYTDTTLAIILNTTDKNFKKRIKYPISPIYIKGKQLNVKAIKFYVDTYIDCNVLIHTSSNRIGELQATIISEKLYKKIIYAFNKKMIDKIIYENYMFINMKSFGGISVIKNHNERKRVDWGKSNKKKAEILAKGGIPYIKADAEVTEDYKGEEWLYFHPADDFFLHWHIKHLTREFNPYIRDYKYTPARAGGGKVSIVSKLNEVKQDRNRANALYTRTLNIT